MTYHLHKVLFGLPRDGAYGITRRARLRCTPNGRVDTSQHAGDLLSRALSVRGAPATATFLQGGDVIMADHLVDHRLQLILSELAARGECRTRQLAEQFHLSEMTVRRDLQELESRGQLRRVHGGAVLLNRDINYSLRLEHDQAQKQLIGYAATRLLKSGQTVYNDAGIFTALALARAIRQGLNHITHLHIVTHGITIATELAGQTPYGVQLIGGDVLQNALSTVGPTALAQISGLAIDVFFMGAGGVDTAMGWSRFQSRRGGGQARGHRPQQDRMRHRR